MTVQHFSFPRFSFSANKCQTYRCDPRLSFEKDTLVSTLAFLLPNFFVVFRYDPRATLLYGTRKNFPVYGSLTAVPGANALTST